MPSYQVLANGHRRTQFQRRGDTPDIVVKCLKPAAFLKHKELQLFCFLQEIVSESSIAVHWKGYRTCPDTKISIETTLEFCHAVQTCCRSIEPAFNCTPALLACRGTSFGSNSQWSRRKTKPGRVQSPSRAQPCHHNAFWRWAGR